MRRLGDVRLPVEVLVEFADGRSRRESWDGRDRWVRFRYRDAAKVVARGGRSRTARSRSTSTPRTTPGPTSRASPGAPRASGPRASCSGSRTCSSCTRCSRDRDAARSPPACARRRRNWGLAAFLLAVNLGLGARCWRCRSRARSKKDLAHRDAAQNMLSGFDYGWWSAWSERQTGAAADFGPEILGVGFVFRNLELLLGGQLPARLFARALRPSGDRRVDGVILAVGALYLVVADVPRRAACWASCARRPPAGPCAGSCTGPGSTAGGCSGCSSSRCSSTGPSSRSTRRSPASP